jgi:hypothetical protein
LLAACQLSFPSRKTIIRVVNSRTSLFGSLQALFNDWISASPVEARISFATELIIVDKGNSEDEEDEEDGEEA